MNGAPDWQDGECCFRCRMQFTLVTRKHHCRNCGNIFCAKCSSQQIPLPKLNIEKNVRVCDGCYEKLSSKSEDPLALAINKSSDANNGTDQQQAKTGKSSSKSLSSGGSSSKSSSSNKPTANASAPSEQELKEEEELQLALALSLSETSTKISFPDCRQFEDKSNNEAGVGSNNISTSLPSSSVHFDHRAGINNTNNVSAKQSAAPTAQTSTTTTNTTQHVISTTDQRPQFVTISEPTKQQQQSNSIQQPTFPSAESQQMMLDHDQELFKFVAEVHTTSESFTNRINLSKTRNRPIADDRTIQATFLKLTDMHAKLLEYIKVHDEERAGYESLQDKLSQISDARAALDALREEHQEKIRQEAAEAERQRQTQLALKLEMMRQKKSQMMQYQREMALQRIQAQEMILSQQQQQPPPPPSLPASTSQGPEHQLPTSVPVAAPAPAPVSLTAPMQVPIAAPVSAPMPRQVLAQQQQHQSVPRIQSVKPAAIQQQPAKLQIDDEAPLISFDD